MNTKHINPAFLESAFNCPWCDAYANQLWFDLFYGSSRYSASNSDFKQGKLSICVSCRNFSIWVNKELIYPQNAISITPNPDLSESIKKDFIEASEIAQKSPRGAAALLRLAVQTLCEDLVSKKNDLNTNIGELVKRGLPERIQMALDSVRIIGNRAVHAGILDLGDDQKTVQKLFGLVNFIAEKMISEPKEIETFFEKLPESQRNQIETRDRNTGGE